MSAIRSVLLVAAAALVTACAADAPTAAESSAAVAARAANPSQLNKDLASVRAATARYHRVEAAVEAGYQPASPCVAIPGAGMGIHYVNFALVGDGVLDVAQPEVLVYEPAADGRLALVAAEYMIPQQMWAQQGHAGLPSLFGHDFEPGPMATWTLHAWVWRNNPSGMFAPFNPTVSCPTGAPAVAAAAHAHH